eukprot:s1302_g5.t1
MVWLQLFFCYLLCNSGGHFFAELTRTAQDGALYSGDAGSSPSEKTAHESQDSASSHPCYSGLLESGDCEGGCGARKAPLEVYAAGSLSKSLGRHTWDHARTRAGLVVLGLRPLVQGQSDILRWLRSALGSPADQTAAVCMGASEDDFPTEETEESQTQRWWQGPGGRNGTGGPQAPTIATAAAHPVAPPVPETDAQLSSLLSTLATHKEALPESIRQMVDAQAEASAASRAKTMHKCIATQTSSTKQLQSLRLQRTQYMAAWTKYLEDLEVNLRQQMEEKSSTMAQFAATEDMLMDAIEQAREQMLVMAGGEVKKEEDEMEVGEVPEVPTAAEAVEDLGTAQQEKVLLEALKKAKESASKEKGAAKRERTPRRKAKDGEAQAISSDEQGL